MAAKDAQISFRMNKNLSEEVEKEARLNPDISNKTDFWIKAAKNYLDKLRFEKSDNEILFEMVGHLVKRYEFSKSHIIPLDILEKFLTVLNRRAK